MLIVSCGETTLSLTENLLNLNFVFDGAFFAMGTTLGASTGKLLVILPGLI
jgi:hypothetical protein